MLGGEIISIPVARAAAAIAAGEIIPQVIADDHSVTSINLKDLLPGSATAFADDGFVPKADKPNSVSVVYDLVVVVVDVSLDQDKNPYDGLKAQYPQYNDKLSDTEMGHRVLRYAEDVRKNNDLTDVKIVFYDKNKDSVQDLSSALENLYRNGEGTHKNKLAGVVLVGNIPLPVVNKGGNRYISMFPYTDFSDQAYSYNSKTNSFERNASVAFPKPEIWHGVIRSPSDDFAGKEQLAEYFDKNHLYYEGVEMFSKFDRKMFFGDLVHEEEQLNPDSFKQYLKYITSFEDLAYMRYNKFWAQELSSQSTEVLKNIPPEIKAKGANAKFLDSLQNANPLANVPDIYSKSIIDQSLIPYYQVLSKYIGSVNDFSYNTARYEKNANGSPNVDSVVGLIGIKDEYTKYYLKSVNDALEKKINEVAAKIQEPLSLVDYSQLTGKIGDQNFVINATDNGLPGTAASLFYNFNYKNEQDGKWYINGTDTSIIDSPKQCYPLLGSTKSSYFDKNLSFNPKAVGGKYSVLTRSLRSDNGATATDLHTTGVYTRMLSPISVGGGQSELFTATGGAYAGQANSDGTYNTGAVIEDNPAYGISAFIHNPLAGKDTNYRGPIEQAFQKGDVIVKVNGQDLNYSYSFDQAIENSYQAVKSVIDTIRNKNLKPSEALKSFPYQIKVIPNGSLDNGDAVAIVGYFSVDFYRAGKAAKQYFSFTVNKDGITTATDPQGNPEVYVLLDTPPGLNFNDPDFYNANSQGAIFTLYRNKDSGYNGGAYDNSAGCNANSTNKNSDRCLGMVASMPVLDPAGSLAPVLMSIPGLGDRLKFPEKVKRNNLGQNSGNEDDYTKHVDSYQFPGGLQTDYHQYDDVDQVYFNSCYTGLPSVTDTSVDTNPYKFVLDPSTIDPNSNHNVNPDFYGQLMKQFETFINSGTAKQIDYSTDNGTAESSTYNPKSSIWAGLDKVDAGDIILNSDPKVTLKDFADHYGLFDGIDNDGNGLTDYKWIDSDADGVFDSKYYDFNEANIKFGIPSWDTQEIARKLLSHDGSYTIPYGVPSFPDKKFDKNVTLSVKADSVKKLSSLILHNEPTDYTISQQMKSQTAFSLPIDNPRYVAFQSLPKKGPAYPADQNQPNKPNLDVQAIINSLGDTNPPVYPGQIQKVKYVNLFDQDITNMAQLQSALVTKATELAAMPGSYRIIDPNAAPDKYTQKEIIDEILKNYLSLVVNNNDADSPASGFNLEKASSKKIYDALSWLKMSIDEKHQYVLQYYLNGDSNGYAADHTLLPSPAGSQAAFGYEAAYLVLNGDKSSFDMNFNKAVPEEKDNVFDPLSQFQGNAGANGEQGAGAGSGAGDQGGAGKADEEFEFVWVQDFLKEMKKFINSLKTEPEFTNECFSPESWNPGYKDKLPVGPAKTGDGSKKDESDKNVPDPSAKQVQLSSYVYREIAGYNDLLQKIEDQKNKPVTSSETVNIGGESTVGTGGAGGASSGSTGVGIAGGDVNAQGTALQQIIDNISKDAGVVNKNSTKNQAGTKTNGGTSSTTNGNGNGNGSSSNTSGSGSGNGSIGTETTGENVGDTGTTVDASNVTSDTTQKEKDLQILKSALVEDKAPISRGVQTKPVETPQQPAETQEVATPVETQKAPEIKPEPNQKWEEYFIGAKYYQKFIPKGPAANVRRLFAELLSDNPFENAAKDESSKYIVESNDTMVADNVSLMKIEAVIFDSKGNADINGSHKVKFSLSSDLVSFQGNNTVESKNGIATVYIKAGKTTGDFYIKEEVLKDNGKVDSGYQVVTKDLHLVAGEPANVEIQSDSGVLVANNQSKMVLNILLKDKFGNIANNSFEKVGIFVNDKAKLDPKTDSDNKLIGTQLDTLDGKASAELFAGDKAGSADVVAVVMDQDLQDQLLAAGDNISGIDFKKHVGTTKSFQVLDKVDLSLVAFDENFQAITSVTADGKSIVRLGVKLLNNGKTVTAFNGPVKFTVLKTNLGNFVSTPPSKLVNGELNPANITFKAGKVTGDEEILVDIPGFASDSFKFKVNSNKATQIVLSGSEDIIDTNSTKQVVLTAKLLDENGNLANSDNGTVINFMASKATSDLINFSENKAVTKDGVATVQIAGKNVSGNANILAQSAGLVDGKISLKINKHVTSDIVKNFSPRALYVSLLGGAYGQVGDQNNLANSILFSKGQVEAISTVTATQSEKKRMFAVDGYGKIDFLTSTVYGKVIAATNSFPYQKVSISDDIAGDDLANVFIVPKTDSPVLLVDEKTNIPDKDGVFVKILDETNKSIFSQDNDGVYVKVGSDTKMKVDKYGRIFINDEVYKLRAPTKDDQIDVGNFAFILSKGGVDIALISFKQNFGKGVQTIDAGQVIQNVTPGVYVEAVSTKNKYTFTTSYTGNSTSEPQGVYLIDNEEDIDANQAPGFGYSSLDGVKKEFGLGFQGSNKHMLLFAAGNSVGDSFVPYASDSGIIYGDPTIKLKVDGELVSKDTGYSKDLGKPIFSGQETIQQMIEFDANGDGYDDLLLVYESGLIRLMENEISNKKFRDRGYILNIYGGIESIAKIDVDNDGYDDLVVGTKQPCNAGEQCVSMIKNTNGNLDRKPLNLALQDKKVYEMKVGDMNNDGCQDLVTSDSSGSISIFYNKSDGKSCQGLETNYGYSRNFGFAINSDLNQASNLFLNYPGMETPDDGKDKANSNGSLASKSNWYKFIQFSLPTTQPPSKNPQEQDAAFSSAQYAQDGTDLQNLILSSNQIKTKDVPQQTFNKNFDFIHINEDGNFKLKSTKQAKDLNGGSVANGDVIEYLIALQNDSNKSISGLMLSDATPTSMTLIQSSLKCLDPGCSDKLEWLDTGTSLRSAVIKNISVPANGKRIISYQMTVDFTPKVHFDLGNNFVKYPSNANDPYQDIRIRPEVNPDGIISYLYSTGPKSYEKFDVNPANDSKNALDDAFKKIGLPSPTDLLKNPNGELSPDVKAALQKFSGSQNVDKDYNGCSDQWNNVLTNAQDTGEAVATGVGNILGAMRCSGAGCLPIPYNIALLTPGALGEGTPGFPAFLAGTPNPPFFGFFLPSYTPSSLRLYVSPTLTMGLGTAICGGPNSASGICFAFAVPGGIPGACSAIKASVDKSVSAAKSAVVDAATGQSAVITDGEGTGGTKGVNMGGNFGSPDSPLSANAKVNIKIPGFPSVITNWMDGEIDEIYSKLLRFPTFYFILPDFSKVAQESKLAGQEFSFSSFHDFAASLSNFPFVKLEGKEIVIKVPAISPKEIAKYKIQADAWMKHMENELQKYNAWNCSANENRKTICDKIVVNMQNLMASVKRTMDMLDKISNMPKDILQFKNMQAKYATQIICYLDAVMNYTGGYIKRQQKIIESWIKTIQDVIRTFKQWKVVMDVMVEYQQSCDKCKSDRFGKLGLLMQLFVAVPDIPIIPLPKWPDVVVDFSQIKTGIKIVWPDVIFRPEPIILPNLPDITLPEVLPDLAIDLSGLDFNVNLPDLSKFSLPTLPDLPQIPLPQLPDLPRPPKIPGLPNVVGKLMTSLKTIFNILCLLKNGFIPIPETTLNTEIETLTQPSVNAILPLIKNLGMQYPPIQYSYVDQIRITGKVSFDIDTNFVYVIADQGAQIWNDGISGFIKNINRITSIPFGQMISGAIQGAINKAAQQAQEQINTGTGAIKSTVDDAVNEIKDSTQNKSSELPLSFDMTEIDSFKKEMDDYVAAVKREATTPDVYHLIATEHFIDSEDPILNRSLADIKDGIKFEDLPDNGNLKQLADIRNQMIASVDSLNSSSDVLGDIEDYNEFNKILVENNNQRIDLIAANPTVSDVGGSNINDNVSGKTLAFSFLGKDIENTIQQAAHSANLSDKRDLIASAIDFTPQSAVSGANQPATPPAGFFVAAGGVNESVLNFTGELNGTTNIIFNDVDKDKDTDIVYSMGGDVYLKTNYKNSPDLPKGDLIVGFTKNTVGDYVNAGGTGVQGVQVPYIGTGKIDISWSPTEDAISYEVILRKSIYDKFSDAAFTFKINVADLSDKNAPRISQKIPNGNYYVSVFAINSIGNKSLDSDVIIAAPQSCADNDAPMPVVNSTDYTLPIFKNLDIDASASFDPDGEVKQYYLETIPFETDKTDPITKAKLWTTVFQKTIWSDLTAMVDEDGNGITFDDKTNPKFNIGPFSNEGDIGDHKFLLHVVDASGKDATVQLTVHVVAPNVSLDQSFATTSVATGTTLPTTAQFPFWLMRSRYIERVIKGKLTLVPRIDKVRESTTGDDGAYNISDFNLDDMILVENADGKIVAEINPKTGNIGKIEPGYKTITNDAVPPNTPTSISVVDQNNQVLGTIYLVSNANSDVKISQNYGFNSANIEFLHGTNVDDLDDADNFVFENLPGNDPDNPGGVVLKNTVENKIMASIDSAGNIVVIDKRITLTQKPNDHIKDPLIIQINFEGKAVGEVYISLLDTAVVIGPDDVPFMSPKKPSEGVLQGSQVSSGKLNIANLVFDPGFKFTQQDLVKRKDFVKVLLKMICVIPRPEALEPFKAGTGYADNNILADYHPDIKEATLLGFVDGYKGEKDAQGLFPFKPENNINRAEAVKIILKALQYRNIVDVSGLKEGDPWFGDYMKAAQDLTPYLKSGKPIRNNFIVTPEEAKDPYKLMTFGELLIMVQRVLDTYNCFEQDTNANGLTDYCEEKYQITDPSVDQDKDGLSNALECTDNLNPTDPDTDGGGVTDGKEIAAHTNPLDPTDDALDDDNDGLSNYDETNIYQTDPHNPDTDGGGKTDGKEVENCGNPLNPADDKETSACKNQSVPGLYIVPAECNTCPCISTFLHKADLIPGDIFFSVVGTYYSQYYDSKPNDKTYIFTKGNEVQIQSINK